MKDYSKTSGTTIPWKIILLGGLAFSLLMCGVYWLVAYSGKGAPPSESWLVNFTIWFVIGTGSGIFGWWVQSYLHRRNMKKDNA